MSEPIAAEETVSLQVKNIGGISETTVELSPGVNILTGRNATNRTSLLMSIMAVLGSDNVAVKGDADEGYIELMIGDTTYTRRMTRQNGTTTAEGNPYLSDTTLADLFAFLLENNDVRQTVGRGDDLQEVIMRPVDTGEIEAEIERHQSQREEIDAQLEEIKRLKQRLPDLEGKKADLQEQIDNKREELSNIEDRIDDLDQDVDDKRDEKQQLEEKIEELNSVRSQLESIRHEIDTQKNSLNVLQDERSELEADKEEYHQLPERRVEDLEDKIERLRIKEETVTESINELQTVIEFNENLLDGSLDLFDKLEDGDGNLTDQLLEGTDDVICWTCGNRTDTAQIETMLDNLRELHTQYMDERSSLNAEIDDLSTEQHHIKEKRRQRMQIDDQLERINNEIDQRETRIEELEERQSTLTDQVEGLEAEVETLRDDSDRDSKLLDLHKKANRLEIEIERLVDERDSTDAEIARIEERANERDNLQAQREQLNSEIESLRTRVKRLEKRAVTQFNDHMESLLKILNYDNLERIWIERTEEQVRQGRKTISKSRFDLHIVRSTADSTVYEDTVDHLSESEREVTGLVFALAGYLVHEVHEEVPFMLLDSVEAIDAPRIADLIDYFQDYTDYLVVALLEEDAQVLDETYQRVTDI